ncbi:MAG TPA: type II toxin-antitoxin system death-on-curing family toxin [Spirochaetota bacterium]|nr:type II toxin-antitoxin system death-on-curing family toxin [Spirochaetota bacterium]
MKQDIVFLTLAEAVDIHRNQIESYGGIEGIRDITLLSSALAVPLATFNGEYLIPDIFGMAAAYAYHICQNHPFADGNKRAALVCSLIFLDFNEIEIDDPDEVLYSAMMDMASGKMKREEFALILKKLSKKPV